MATVYQRAAARRDLVEHFVHLAENAGLDKAERFLKNAQASFDDLADRPMIGAPVKLRSSALAGIRKWRIKDFDKYLIFYLPRPGAISVVRVLYATRDWWTLLGVEAE
jgi:toxin ParE1/3/4